MKKNVFVLILCMILALGLLAGCGAEPEADTESVTEEVSEDRIQEIEEALAGEVGTSFMGVLDYVEEEGDTIRLTILMAGYEGTISDDLTPGQITFGGDLADAFDVSVTPSEETGMDVEVTLSIPKGQLSAENLELDGDITLAADSMTDAEGQAITKEVSGDVMLIMKNEARDAGKGTILICDDAFPMQMMLRNVLTNEGYQVVGEASNGSQAVEKYQELDPDLVIMDIAMPEMDGIQALKKIKSMDPGAIVVMSAVRGQQNQVVEAIQSGAKDFIVKPFQMDLVLEAVKKAIG